MHNYKAGDRVGAILNSTPTQINFLGYGVYQGDKPCPFLAGRNNPCILLDNGDMVWGCQCYWGDDKQVKPYLADHVSKGVIVKDVRLSDHAPAPSDAAEFSQEDAAAIHDILGDEK